MDVGRDLRRLKKEKGSKKAQLMYNKQIVAENKIIAARAVELLEQSEFDAAEEQEVLSLNPFYTSSISRPIKRQLISEFDISSQRANTAVAKALRQARAPWDTAFLPGWVSV